MKNKPYPEPLKSTWLNWRIFKRDKRWEFREAITALDVFNRGCAFIPRDAYHHYCQARDHLKQVKRLLSEKEWGR